MSRSHERRSTEETSGPRKRARSLSSSSAESACRRIIARSPHARSVFGGCAPCSMRFMRSAIRAHQLRTRRYSKYRQGSSVKMTAMPTNNASPPREADAPEEKDDGNNPPAIAPTAHHAEAAINTAVAGHIFHRATHTAAFREGGSEYAHARYRSMAGMRVSSASSLFITPVSDRYDGRLLWIGTARCPPPSAAPLVPPLSAVLALPLALSERCLKRSEFESSSLSFSFSYLEPFVLAPAS
mmetsp:Transcript_2756/g.6955  ORF Transcript_2756/g.6955 Transcript_2756/m.6955 type:complete len:241 (-) Transcript_2756:202-924(-)